MPLAESPQTSLIEKLVALIGGDNVLTDEYSCSLYAQDVYSKGIPALAVVRPSNTEELAGVVEGVTAAGHAIIARGGGMSYTSGYVPRESGSVIVDMRRMNSILEINTEDMYVTVQCGCTWKSLNEALDGTGLRTPYWGTLSGIHATVGGGMSQNSIFWGSARHGTAVDSVLSLEVVLADGSVVRTGANAQSNGSPFFRHYGPDLTGLFTSDTGALGLKATATLQLVPVREFREQLSFDFVEYESLVHVMSEIARAGLADECFAFDPRLSTVRMQRESLMSDVKKLAGVLTSGKSVLGAIKDGARIAIAGRGYMKDVKYSLHILIEERTDAATADAVARVRKVCERYSGSEIENSIPKILRANPFTPLNNVVGPNGERWVPVHTIVPHSRAASTFAAVVALFEKHEALMEKHGIGYGFLFATVSHNGFVIEPVFFTPDALDDLHRETVEDAVLRKLPCFDPNPEASEVTAMVRAELIELFREAGGVHMQIGKSYPYREGLRSESWRVIEAVKLALDPEGRVNPGSLGLD